MRASAAIYTMLCLRQRINDRGGFSSARDIGEIRGREPALAGKHMAGATLPLRPEHSLAVGNIPGKGVVDRRAAECVDERDDFPDGRVRKPLGPHRRARHAILYDVERLTIGHADVHTVARHNRGSDFSAATAGTMTRGACLVVERVTFRNRLLVAEKRILRSGSPAALTQQRSRGAHDQQSCNEKTCPHVPPPNGNRTGQTRTHWYPT